MPIGRVTAGFIGLVAAFVLYAPAPAMAIDWLGNHLESQRENNLRQHQQRMQRPQRARPAQQGDEMTLSPAERAGIEQRQRAFLQRMAPEYHRRVRSDGQAQADQWLRQRSWDFGAEEGRRAREARGR